MKAKKILALILCASMVLSTVSTTALGANETLAVTPGSGTEQTAPVTTGYGDSADSWAASSIARWSTAGVVKGDQNGNFNHAANLSCAELAQIFVNMFGLTVKAENTFADLKGDEWYADAVLKCVAAGILKGDGTNINAMRTISRQEIMVMFGRAVGITPDAKPDLSMFSDAGSVASWAAGYLAPLVKMGILTGSGDGTINATGYIDRASTASLLDKSVASYITAPGEYKVEGAHQFVVVNAGGQEGEIVISGTAAGVIVAAGTGGVKVFARNLTAGTVKVDGVAALSLEGKSTVGEVVANATGAVGIAKGVTVADMTVNAAAAITNSGTVADMTVNAAAAAITNTNSGTVTDMTVNATAAITNSGTVADMTVNATATIANSGTIKALVAHAAAVIDNKGTITKADIKADGVVLSGARPRKLAVDPGIKNPTDGNGKEVKPVAPPTGGGYVAVAPSIAIVGQSRAIQGILFTEEADGKIAIFDENRVLTSTTVSLKKGDYNYKNVRLVVEIPEADKTKFQAIAIDSNDVAYNIVTSGWGSPTEGFELEDETALVYLVATEKGPYSATIKLVDVKNNNAVIASTSISVPVIDITGKAAIIGTTTYDTVTAAGNAAVAGDVIALLKEAELAESATIQQGVSLNVLRGTKLTVPANMTLTLEGNLANDGTVENAGTVKLAAKAAENGNLINMGTFTNTGSIDIAATGGKGVEAYQNLFLNVDVFTSTGTITNHGDFVTGLFGTSTLSGGTMTVEANGTVAVGLAGTLIVGTGANMAIDPKGTVYVDETAKITIASGGKLVLGDEDAPPAPIPSPAPPIGDGDGTNFNPVLSNAGTITSNGTIENYSDLENTGTIQNGDKPTSAPFPTIQNEGFLQNHGTITNYGAIGNRGFDQDQGFNEGFILNHGTVDNYSAITNVGTIINEEHTAASPGAEFTRGIMYNHKDGGSIINAGYIDIGSELVSGAIFNGGAITNVKTGTIGNYALFAPEVTKGVDAQGLPIPAYGTIANEGEIWLGENSMLLLDIENAANASSKKTEGVIAVCDDLNLAMAVNMGGTVRLNNNITTSDTIIINNAVTLDGDNSCLTGEIVGKTPADKSTILIGDGTAKLTEKVVIKDLIVCGPNTKPNEWDEGEYGIKVFWADDVTLDSVWMIYANAGMQVNSATVTLMNDTCLAANEFGGIELANGADNHGASTLNIDKDAIIMHIGNAKPIPAIWKDTAAAGTINDTAALLTEAAVQPDGKVYYYVKDSEMRTPVKLTMTDATLQPDYAVNLATTKENRLEYAWGVNFTCNGQKYQVSTKHFKPGSSQPTRMTLQEMQTNLWNITDKENATVVQGVNVMLTIEGNNLAWTFYRPDTMVGDLTEETPVTVVPS